MANNYMIKTDTGLIFSGWNSLGQIVMNGPDKGNLIYGMSRTLAMRTIPKIEEFTKSKCHVEKIP